jgi:hypothetical protein
MERVTKEITFPAAGRGSWREERKIVDHHQNFGRFSYAPHHVNVTGLKSTLVQTTMHSSAGLSV